MAGKELFRVLTVRDGDISLAGVSILSPYRVKAAAMMTAEVEMCQGAFWEVWKEEKLAFLGPGA